MKLPFCIALSLRATFTRAIFTLALISTLASTLMLNASQSAQAQSKNGGGGGIFYYSVNLQGLNPESLNQSLSAAGYPELGDLYWGQGGGFAGMFQKYLLGVEYQSLFGQTLKKDQEALSLEGDYALLHLGYLLVATPALQVYPYLGTGLGRLKLHSTESLSSLLSVSQGSTPHIGQSEGLSWLLDLGLGAHFILPMSPQNQGDARGPALTVRTGYLWQPLGTVWQHNRLPMQGPQDLHSDGFYFRLGLGFGGYR